MTHSDMPAAIIAGTGSGGATRKRGQGMNCNCEPGRWECAYHAGWKDGYEAAQREEQSRIMLPEHKCKPIARMYMAEGRDWWLGLLTESLKDWPTETHCLHIRTPLKSFVLAMNRGDWQQLAVAAFVAVGSHPNMEYVERLAAGMKLRATNASASPPGDDEYGLAKAYEQVADHLPPGWKL